VRLFKSACQVGEGASTSFEGVSLVAQKVSDFCSGVHIPLSKHIQPQPVPASQPMLQAECLRGAQCRNTPGFLSPQTPAVQIVLLDGPLFKEFLITLKIP
jgi:hypothetical protein